MSSRSRRGVELLPASHNHHTSSTYHSHEQIPLSHPSTHHHHTGSSTPHNHVTNGNVLSSSKSAPDHISYANSQTHTNPMKRTITDLARDIEAAGEFKQQTQIWNQPVDRLLVSSTVPDPAVVEQEIEALRIGKPSQRLLNYSCSICKNY